MAQEFEGPALESLLRGLQSADREIVRKSLASFGNRDVAEQGAETAILRLLDSWCDDWRWWQRAVKPRLEALGEYKMCFLQNLLSMADGILEELGLEDDRQARRYLGLRIIERLAVWEGEETEDLKPLVDYVFDDSRLQALQRRVDYLNSKIDEARAGLKLAVLKGDKTEDLEPLGDWVVDDFRQPAWEETDQSNSLKLAASCALRSVLKKPLERITSEPTDSLNAPPLKESDFANSDVIYEVLMALGRVGGQAAAERLVGLLEEDAPLPVDVVAEALYGIRNPVGIRPLFKRFSRDTYHRRTELAEHLRAFRHPDSVECLAELARDRYVQVRVAAVNSLGAIAFPECVPPLANAVTDHRTEVRVAAAESLGAIALPECVPPLVRALFDRSVRHDAAAALENVESEPLPLHALMMATSTDVQERVKGADILAESSDGLSVEAVENLLKDASPRVILAAMQALAAQDTQRARTLVPELLRHRYKRVRLEAAAYALVLDPPDEVTIDVVTDMGLCERDVDALAARTMIVTRSVSCSESSALLEQLMRLSGFEGKVLQDLVLYLMSSPEPPCFKAFSVPSCEAEDVLAVRLGSIALIEDPSPSHRLARLPRVLAGVLKARAEHGAAGRKEVEKLIADPPAPLARIRLSGIGLTRDRILILSRASVFALQDAGLLSHQGLADATIQEIYAARGIGFVVLMDLLTSVESEPPESPDATEVLQR